MMDNWWLGKPQFSANAAAPPHPFFFKFYPSLILSFFILLPIRGKDITRSFGLAQLLIDMELSQ